MAPKTKPLRTDNVKTDEAIHSASGIPSPLERPIRVHEAPNRVKAIPMSRFERIYLFLVFATLLSAVYIGFKQNEINQNLLDLHYALSIEVTYQDGRIIIYNKGQSNIFLWGDKIGEKPSIEQRPRLITPAGSYYLLTAELEQKARPALGNNGKAEIPFEIYITDEKQRKFVVNCQFYLITLSGVFSIHTQTLGISQGTW